MRLVNECLRLVRLSNRREINQVRIGLNEGARHVAKKQEICAELLRQGKFFMTEAIFKKGGRADILVLDDFLVIEILDSEKDSNIENKKSLYPKGLRFEVVRC